jgi:hypothetical protein
VARTSPPGTARKYSNHRDRPRRLAVLEVLAVLTVRSAHEPTSRPCSSHQTLECFGDGGVAIVFAVGPLSEDDRKSVPKSLEG